MTRSAAGGGTTFCLLRALPCGWRRRVLRRRSPRSRRRGRGSVRRPARSAPAMVRRPRSTLRASPPLGGKRARPQRASGCALRASDGAIARAWVLAPNGASAAAHRLRQRVSGARCGCAPATAASAAVRSAILPPRFTLAWRSRRVDHPHAAPGLTLICASQADSTAAQGGDESNLSYRGTISAAEELLTVPPCVGAFVRNSSKWAALQEEAASFTVVCTLSRGACGLPNADFHSRPGILGGTWRRRGTRSELRCAHATPDTRVALFRSEITRRSTTFCASRRIPRCARCWRLKAPKPLRSSRQRRALKQRSTRAMATKPLCWTRTRMRPRRWGGTRSRWRRRECSITR